MAWVQVSGALSARVTAGVSGWMSVFIRTPKPTTAVA